MALAAKSVVLLPELKHFRLAPRFTPVCRSRDRLVLSSEDEVRCIDTPLLAETLDALIDPDDPARGTYTLFERHGAAAVHEAIEELSAARTIAPMQSHSNKASYAYWDSIGVAPPQGEISLLSLCSEAAELIPHALMSLGLSIKESAPLLLVTTNDYLHSEIAAIQRERRTPWLLAKPVGHTIWLGPLFIPGRTVCWECLARWMKSHRWAQAAFYGWERDNFPPQPSVESVPTTIGLAAGMIATVVGHHLATNRLLSLENAVWAFDTRTFQQSWNVVRAWPDCTCSSGQPLAPAGDLRSFVSPITSVISSIEVSSEPIGSLFHAHAAFAAPLPKGTSRMLLSPQHSAGKGATVADAEWRCIAEALERYSLIYRGDEEFEVGTAGDVDSICLESIILFSDAQYNYREAWNASHSELHWVPERLRADACIPWVKAESLSKNGSAKFVPAALCYMDLPFASGANYCAADTNGCAAGETLRDAILHSLLELIERDSVAIWWYNRLRRPEVKLESFLEGSFLQFSAAFSKMGRRIHLLDVTTDLGLPAFVAVAPLYDGSQPCFGAAASVSANEAAQKALSEVAQICCWTAAGHGSAELRNWIHKTNAFEHEYLMPGDPVEAPDDTQLNGVDALDYCVRQLERAGLQAYFVDMTRPEINLPVVRAIVPGLRHFWARLAPGRLYSVPVKMGWLPRALKESELNPIPCMI